MIKQTHSIRKQLLVLVCIFAVFAVGISVAKPEREKRAETKKPTTKVAPTKPRTEPPAQTPSTTPPQEQPQAIPDTTTQTPTNIPAKEQPVTDATASMTGEQIKWQVISGGGVSSSSASYKLNATLGQTAVGITSSPSYKVSQGFWYSGSTGCCINRRGNVNNSVGDGVTVADLTFLVQYLFNGGPTPVCTEEANVNGLAGITVADLTYLVQFLFNGGQQPPLCP